MLTPDGRTLCGDDARWLMGTMNVDGASTHDDEPDISRRGEVDPHGRAFALRSALVDTGHSSSGSVRGRPSAPHSPTTTNGDGGARAHRGDGTARRAAARRQPSTATARTRRQSAGRGELAKSGTGSAVSSRADGAARSQGRCGRRATRDVAHPELRAHCDPVCEHRLGDPLHILRGREVSAGDDGVGRGRSA